MALFCGAAAVAWSAEPAALELADGWRVRVTVHPGQPAVEVDIPRSEETAAVDEKYEALPVFNPNAPGYAKGAQLRGVRAQETTTPGLLDPASVVVRGGAGPDAAVLARGVDYQFDDAWGTLGRVEGGAIAAGQTVWISYRFTPMRLDSLVAAAGGKVELRQGEPRAAAPLPAPIKEGERLLGRVWQPGRLDRLDARHLFSILETACPEPAKSTPSVAEAKLPRTMAKLRSGEPLRILAWGDSVTESVYLPNRETAAWQHQFVARLQKRFPQARIELRTEGWGGRTTAAYLAEPAGSERNYQEKVLAVKPDLIVSEFVNDAGLPLEQVKTIYARLLADFQAQGAEWLILTPHYVRPDWMGLDRERDIDEDPRPYVAFLREFAHAQPVALADAARRYGRLWRQGLPHVSLMLNSINHPDERGMAIFADALMEIFP